MTFGGRNGGVTRDLRGLAAGTALALLLAGCATAPQSFENVSAAELQGIDQACEQTLGAHPGDSYFDGCRSSLATAVQRRAARRQLAQAHADCVRGGQKEGSSELALCVLAAHTGASPAARPKPLTAASHEEIHRRAQLSCAKIGLDPADLAFSDCVAELENSVAQADSPSV